MTEIVARTCSEIRKSTEPGSSNLAVESRPLDHFREEPAYVLLGDPGAGKTTAFDRECAALGNDALQVSPRDLIHFEVADHPEWFGKTLFIDGLDEVRAGAPDARTPFDRIRQKLDALGRPPISNLLSAGRLAGNQRPAEPRDRGAWRQVDPAATRSPDSRRCHDDSRVRPGHRGS